jgi:RNA polymerase sigma factor (sigma-70 family)
MRCLLQKSKEIDLHREELKVTMQDVDVQAANEGEYYFKYNDKDKHIFITTLYKQFSKRLKSRLISLVRSPDVAEDIAHDAFMRINALDNPEAIENPWGYLYTISHNLVKDRAKANKVREKYRISVSYKEDENVDQLSPEYNVLAQEKFNIAARAIENLPPKCRKVFLMHKVHNLSHKEIAETMGITKHAVEKHVIRAMSRCHASMSKAD